MFVSAEGGSFDASFSSSPPLQAHQQNAAPFQPAPSPFPVRSSAG